MPGSLAPHHAPPLDWLLDPAEPGVRLRTLVELLGLPPDAADVVEARRLAATGPEVTRQLARVGADGGFGDLRGTDRSSGTAFQLARLLHLGHPPRDPALVPLLRAYLAARQVPERDDLPAGAFSFGSRKGAADPADVAACMTGDALALTFAILGPVEEARQATLFLLRTQRHDGGWLHCHRWSLGVRAKALLGPGKLQWPEEGDPSVRSCRFATFRVLRGLAALPPELRDDAITKALARAAEFFLSRHVTGHSDAPHTEAVPKVPRFSKSFALMGTPLRQTLDQLAVARTLVDLGYATDPRLRRTLEHVRNVQLPDGKWAAETASEGMLDQPVGEPSKWVTLDALVLLRRAARSHGQDWDPRAGR